MPPPRSQKRSPMPLPQGPKPTPAWFPPFTAIKAGATYPHLPLSWRTMDPFLLGAAPPTPLPGSKTARPRKKFIFRFGLENKHAECFRNAGLQLLLHTPRMYWWLMNHNHEYAAVDGEACLACGFRDLALHYFPASFDDRAVLYGKLDDFYQGCREVFWGPRSRLKRKRPEVTVGPGDGLGGNVSNYVTWLVQSLFDEEHAESAEHVFEKSLLKRMFWMSFLITRRCSNGHCRIVSRRERNWVQMVGRIGPKLEVQQGLEKWLAELVGEHGATECTRAGCGSKSFTRKIEIENAPTILLIRAPLRASTKDMNSFFFGVPYAKTIDISAYSATSESLVYSLQSMAMELGNGYRKVGHAVSLVQAADGKAYKIDNEKVEHVVNPSVFVDSAQKTDVDQDSRLLPTFFVYVREREELEPISVAERTSNSSGDAVRISSKK